jgi:shikimate dehydrogenase
VRLAVLGSPIAHSKSPALHAAAYAALGLNWEYEAVEVTEAELPGFVGSLDESWRGLSLTMPLKRAVLPLLGEQDAMVGLTGVANTVVFDRGIRGFNTDVYGITEAFRSNGVEELGEVQILGGGATAVSALVAVAELGAQRVQLTLRDPSKGAGLERLARTLGVEVMGFSTPDAVISTLPGHADHGFEISEAIRATAVLFDVAYDPWPSRLAERWTGQVISGLDLLTLQALAQVRAFVTGSPEQELDDEASVLAAMRRAVAA